MKKVSKIINLTEHDVVFMPDGANAIETFPPSGTVARVAVTYEHTDITISFVFRKEIVMKATFGDVENKPQKGSADFFIVSRMVADAMKDSGEYTSHLLIPSGLVRDAKGSVIGCLSFETP